MNDHYKKRLGKIKPSPQCYKEIDKISGRKLFGSNLSKDPLVHNGATYYSVEDKLKIFSEFYEGVFNEKHPTADPELYRTVNNTVTEFANNHTGQVITNFSVDNRSSEPVEEKIFIKAERITSFRKYRINSKKSAGFDKISNFLIKKFSVEVDEFLAILFNNCINNGYFPSNWKIAKLVPIAKKQNATKVGDFRPISVLSNIGKLFERVVACELDAFCDENNIIPNNQFGFKNFHSTENALSVFLNNIIQNLRTRKCVVALDLDLEKAFDSVWTNGLLFKLISLNFPIAVLKLIDSFLHSRSLDVDIDSFHSEFIPVRSGVPQGSIMGPKLFNIFLADFPISYSSSNEVKSILYADDTIIFSSAIKPNEATQMIKNNVPTLLNYYSKWGIRLNESKSALICFRNAYGRAHYNVVKESKSISLQLNGHNIPLKNDIKYLGVHLHHRLRFNPHVMKILNKSVRVTSVLKPLLNSKSLRSDTKLLIYKTLIRPVISYSFISWFTVSPSMALKIEKFERKILRHCTQCYRKPNKKFYSNLHIYEKSNIVPIMTYLISLAKRSLERIKCHDNELIKKVYEENKEQSLFDNFYLSPVNLVHDRSASFITKSREKVLTLPFYEKRDINMYRG